MKQHVNIPIFIPHLGCPNQCVFCNQRSITGVSEFDISTVYNTIEEALATVNVGQECEIAFFGGSFTGIERELMIKLLSIADEYVRSGKVNSVRCSTRPDYISAEILDILEKYNVKTIELGLQSSSDSVLLNCKRGHTNADEVKACRLIRERGFSLVGQMMIGLPGAEIEDELETARFIVSSGCDAARVYPTVVFRDTELCDLSLKGEYTPLTVDDAVSRSAKVIRVLLDGGVDIIRIGLCASDMLLSDKTYFAGPNHPSIGELCEGELFYFEISSVLSSLSLIGGEKVTVFIPKNSTSKAIGHKKSNKIRLINDFGLSAIRFVEDDGLFGYEVRVNIERKEDQCT